MGSFQELNDAIWTLRGEIKSICMELTAANRQSEENIFSSAGVAAATRQMFLMSHRGSNRFLCVLIRLVKTEPQTRSDFSKKGCREVCVIIGLLT